MGCHCTGFGSKAGVEGRLAATRLIRRELDPIAEALQHLDRGSSDPGPEAVHEARDKELHGLHARHGSPASSAGQRILQVVEDRVSFLEKSGHTLGEVGQPGDCRLLSRLGRGVLDDVTRNTAQ